MKTLESKAIPVFTYECMDRGFGLCNTPESEKLLSKNSPILKTTLCLYTISTPEGKREGTQIEQATCTAKLSMNQIGHFRAD